VKGKNKDPQGKKKAITGQKTAHNPFQMPWGKKTAAWGNTVLAANVAAGGKKKCLYSDKRG